ncbi:MAG TPA: phospho-N-acetylmuramoyl-pentapeptide-transferase [Bacteroidales bacterium]|nr:phospho-N-acetylmuramoyl-pentapeptide-transferase [Bacteroidales bacterium]
MLYYLFEYLDKVYDVPGAGVFQFISFRAGMAVIFSLFISMITGRRIIRYLQKMQIGEVVRDLGIEGQEKKAGTPTMGGIIIISAIIIPALLFARLDNIYIILMLITTLWLGFIGFVDDYIKVFKKDKAGLQGRFKILGQVTLGIVVGATLYFHEAVVIREEVALPLEFETSAEVLALEEHDPATATYIRESVKSTKTTIPFLKGNEFDYASILRFLGENYAFWAFLIFIPVVILIITAVSNGANITDGLDGLATGTSAIIGVTLGALAYVSGNIVFADYLNIMYIPYTGELVVFIAAFVGACIGFLWYNSYPAQVFMGDTGSLALGGIIAVFAISIRKELLIPVLCGIFFIENLSVVAQVTWFKFTKKRFGQGRRLLLMAPLHHHFQLKGYHEAKIVQRFFIVGIILAVFTVITLKLR